MARKKVFISYDWENDRHYKNLLLAWDSHDNFEFSISDHSIDISVNSENANYIKQKIAQKIGEARHFLVIVGEKTYLSNWVRWEIYKAVELKKNIVAVKTYRDNITPDELYGVGANWAMSFTFSAITNAINS